MSLRAGTRACSNVMDAGSSRSAGDFESLICSLIAGDLLTGRAPRRAPWSGCGTGPGHRGTAAAELGVAALRGDRGLGAQRAQKPELSKRIFNPRPDARLHAGRVLEVVADGPRRAPSLLGDAIDLERVKAHQLSSVRAFVRGDGGHYGGRLGRLQRQLRSRRRRARVPALKARPVQVWPMMRSRSNISGSASAGPCPTGVRQPAAQLAALLGAQLVGEGEAALPARLAQPHPQGRLDHLALGAVVGPVALDAGAGVVEGAGGLHPAGEGRGLPPPALRV